MNQFGETYTLGRARGRKLLRFRLWVLLAAPLAAILSQVYVPLFFSPFTLFDLPLLVTVYFAVMRRSPMFGIFAGAGIGLVQDALSQQPLGMFGMVKTVVGFIAASVSVRFDVERAPVRFTLACLFFLLHHFAYAGLAHWLLGQAGEAEFGRALLMAFLNALVAVPLFHLLDRLKKDED